MILFFHGLDSGIETNKFAVIENEKAAIQIDYREQGFDEINKMLDDFIVQTARRCRPGQSIILAGHSLGGYWALKKGVELDLKVVLINPQLFPVNKGIRDLDKYHVIDVDNAASVFTYLELSDEVIDVPRTLQFLKNSMHMMTLVGGHHRVSDLHNINKLIERASLQQADGRMLDPATP